MTTSTNIPNNITAQQSTSITLPLLLTQKDLAKYLCKSEAWCERARWAGDGPKFIKLGRHIRYKADDVAAWIESCSGNTSTSMEASS
jgi:predicted DNA-binding transcriptional regulator AlpA